MNKVELLAPAGNFDCLKTAINNGADAVYLGGKSFSARAFADNFDDKEIVEAIKYAHLRNVNVYITLNTLLNESEIDNAYNKAVFYYNNNVDGLLIQDLGLFYRLKKDYPDYNLHASTQMHIHNIQGVKNAKELGFDRVVLSRESDLDLIKQACKQGIDIECFVHGAICVSYSGQCLMSSLTKNRSANKGMCAQCCRLKYHLYDNNNLVNTDSEYLLSPKDMCLINDIGKLIYAGVKSFKIEGRMKSSAYVGYITRLYRKAIDLYYENKEYKISDFELNNIKLLFNRGFTNSYLLNNNDDLFSNIRPNHMGIEIGKVINVKDNNCFIKLNKSIYQFDGIRIINSNSDTGLILNMIKVNDLLVSKAFENDIIEIETKDKVDIGDTVLKTLDYNLEKEINSTKDKKIPIDLEINANSNDYFNVKCNINNKQFIYKSNYLIEQAIKSPINDTNIFDSFKSVDNHPYVINNITVSLNNSFIPLKTINDLRRDFYVKLDEFILNDITKTSKEINLNNNIKEFNQEKNLTSKDFGLLNPVININSKYFDDNNLVSEFGGLLLKGNKNAYYTLNISNSYGFEFLLKLGFKNILLSTELSQNQIELLSKNFKERTSLDIKPYCMVKGIRTLMNLKLNPFNKYIKNSQNIRISDGNNVYSFNKNNGYFEIKELYNSINLAENSTFYNNYYQ